MSRPLEFGQFSYQRAREGRGHPVGTSIDDLDGQTAVLEVRVLGAFRLRRAGCDIHVPAGQESTVIQRLVLNGGSIHQDRLIEELWPDDPVKKTSARLRTVLSRLRKHTGVRVVARGDVIRLLDPFWCDLDEFIRVATVAVSGRETPEITRELCLQAQALWLGPPLEDHRYHPWAQHLRRRATDLRECMWALFDMGTP